MIADGPGGAVLDIRVIPRAGRTEFAGPRDGALLVRLARATGRRRGQRRAARPSRQALGVPKSQTSPISGERSREACQRSTGVDRTPPSQPAANLSSCMNADFLIENADLHRTCARAGAAARARAA